GPIPSGFSYSGHTPISQWRQDVTSVNNGQGTVILTVEAIVADDDQLFVDPADGAGETLSTIIGAKVFNGAGTEVLSGTNGLTITGIGTTAVTFSGMQEGWDYQIETSPATPFSAVQVTGVGGRFKLGQISLLTARETPD